MAKRKPKPTAQETLEDLAAIAATLPDDVLDDELEDVVEAEARLVLETIHGATTLAKLEYLHERGYHLERLRQIVREAQQEAGQ